MWASVYILGLEFGFRLGVLGLGLGVWLSAWGSCLGLRFWVLQCHDHDRSYHKQTIAKIIAMTTPSFL